MPVTVKINTEKIDNLKKNLNEINGKRINIGVLSSADGMIKMIAEVNEYGAVIKPKSGKYLAIPLSKAYKGRSPREFSNLFTVRSKSGDLFLAREKGKKDLEFCYYLATSVTIPERAFIRGGFESSRSELYDKAEQLIEQLAEGKIDTQTFLDFIGNFMQGKIRQYMIDLRNPANANITVAVKGSSNPLVDTGHLILAIDYEVI